MKTKQLTPQQLQKAALKKQKEIQKWEKEKARPKTKLYLFYLIFIICLVYVTDEIASQISTLMKTEIANDLMAKYGEKSIGMFDTISIIAIPFQALSIFYKPLSDRFGRKVFLIINTLGMSLGMIVIAMSHGIAVYIIGAILIFFFVPHDMQVVYIMESSPSKHRAKIYSIVKCVATLGIMLVPVLRKTLMTSASDWRKVFFVPAVVGVVTSFVALLLSKETDAFIDSRLEYLRMTDEEIAKAKEEKSGKEAQGSFWQGLKFVARHYQLRWVFIATALANFGAIITLQYQTVLSYGFAKNIAAAEGIDLTAALDKASIGPVTAALFLFPVGSAVAQLLVGFFADSLGRRASAIIMTGLTTASFILLVAGSYLNWNPYLTGAFCGAAVGAYWGATDIDAIIISESSPTNLRSSILSAQFLAMGVGYAVAYVIGIPLITHFGNSSVPIVTLCLSVPGMLASLVVLITKVHDTKGVDLDKVTGTEWD